MSLARGGNNAGHYYSNIVKPYCLNLAWTVTPTNGLGITSLKSNGWVQNVFMHTSTTPTANGGMTNPNPLAGYALIQMKQNFNYYLGAFAEVQPPASGSDVKIDNSALVVGQPYIITTLGNATTAKWQAIGVPVGVTPAVGVSFIALTDGSTGNTLTSRVQVPSVSGTSVVEVIGNPNVSISNSIASYSGQFLMLQFLSPSGSGTISAPTFTGSALGNHTHDTLYKNAAVADGATTRVNVGTNLLGANTGSDITVAGAGANGGVRNASAGTPAGTVSAPTFTSTSVFAAAAPATGSIVMMSLFFDGSSVTIDGL